MSPLQSDTALENRILERSAEFTGVKTNGTAEMLRQQAEALDPNSKEHDELMVAHWNMLSMERPHDQEVLSNLYQARLRVNRSRFSKTLLEGSNLH